MRRKSQVAVFVIVGLLIVVFVSILISVKNISLGRESADAKLFSANRDRLQRFLDECTENAAVRSNVAYGMNKQSRQEYESYFENELHTCMQNLVSTFEEQALVIGLGAPSAETQINEDNIVFSINYPISLSNKELSYEIADYTYIFDKTHTVAIEKEKPMLSSDELVNIYADEDTKLADIKNSRASEITIKVFDKRELPENANLLGNLGYGISPGNYFANDTIELSFFAEELGFESTEGLYIAWWSHHGQEWGLLPTTIDNGIMKARTRYLTYYGVMRWIQAPEIEEEEEAPQSAITVPPDPPHNDIIVYGGDVLSIFNSIRQDMGGTYGLSLNPKCVEPPFISTNAICRTGYSPQCGLTAVHCKVNRLGSTDINILFRHEIVHNLQQLNGGCGNSVRTEWGAEYISGSTYYTFKLNNQPVTAQQIAGLMEERNCTGQELRDAALCRPGSYERLAAKGCLLAGNDVATW
ncbi:TPA: hypothetical protein HA239_03935 [Candidatus Woesearchaeota archaeon]|nr:hypothetical protein QT06_C0001G0795 [archaeon GW2011_AR15]MBS3103425.1 hypothetical protein [Candidatus Woesearchaeota archaeon]HIH41542.1 hypothetical protein [Candidatus Woesearchaeota archaeon]